MKHWLQAIRIATVLLALILSALAGSFLLYKTAFLHGAEAFKQYGCPKYQRQNDATRIPQYEASLDSGHPGSGWSPHGPH